MSKVIRALTLVGWLLGSGVAWTAVYYLIVVRGVGANENFWAHERVMAYVAFIVAPAVTFMPIAHRLRIPLYDLEAIIAWSTLAFVFTFVDPGKTPSMPVLLVFLVSLVMSLATILTLLSYAVGLRLFARRSQKYDFVRARREGYLSAIFCVGLVLLSVLHVLSAVNAALMGMIVLLLEIFLLSRGGQLRNRSRQVDGRARYPLPDEPA